MVAGAIVALAIKKPFLLFATPGIILGLLFIPVTEANCWAILVVYGSFVVNIGKFIFLAPIPIIVISYLFTLAGSRLVLAFKKSQAGKNDTTKEKN
ncbi:MAG: hypothetical protein JXA52_09785 [Planctomycetes bacterium]|nr:hypothetical protein [Planctomycetota bacterium]